MYIPCSREWEAIIRELVEQELEFSQGIIAGGHELVPRFRIQTAEGNETIFVQLPDDLEERENRMHLVRLFMKVKLARSFVMASELVAPDASMAVGVNRNRMIGAVQMINRKTLKFGPVQWLTPDYIDPDIPKMLPARLETVDAAEVAEVERLIKHNEGLELRQIK